jgi:hypothetical protein
MRSLVRTLLLAPLAVLLSGCIAFGTIDKRATALNESAGTAQNRAILLNLVRASRFEPLYFLAMTQLNGSATADLKLGLPELTVGPRQAATQKDYILGGTANNDSNVLDNSTVTSFQESVLGSKDFYAGLLAPLDLRDVDLLLHQGFSRELIFDLVIQKATITVHTDDRGDGDPTVVYNDPSDAKRYAVFQGYIREAMVHGLTTQSFEAPDDSADTDDTSAGAGQHHKPKLTEHAELCYDRALASVAAREDFHKGAKLCGVDAPAVRASGEATDLMVDLHGQKLTIDVTTRSIYGIFAYLGAMIAQDDASRVSLHAYPELLSETTVEAPLLVVNRAGGIGDQGCFVGLGYEGQHYCVPQEGADNTKKIFNILNALLALKTASGDLPITQTVRIAP